MFGLSTIGSCDQLCRQRRKRPQCAELPIIAVTGKTVGGERERCIAAGASDFIAKPVDTTALLTTISHWLLEATTPMPPS